MISSGPMISQITSMCNVNTIDDDTSTVTNDNFDDNKKEDNDLYNLFSFLLDNSIPVTICDKFADPFDPIPL